jgi:hypothetical protein
VVTVNAFEDEEKATALANGTAYALLGSVETDARRVTGKQALHRPRQNSRTQLTSGRLGQASGEPRPGARTARPCLACALAATSAAATSPFAIASAMS